MKTQLALRSLACALLTAAAVGGAPAAHATPTSCTHVADVGTKVLVHTQTAFDAADVTASARQSGASTPVRLNTNYAEHCDQVASSLAVNRADGLGTAASADLARGQLRAFARDGSEGEAQFGERLNFVANSAAASGTPQYATLRVSFDGMASKANGPEGWAVGILSVGLGTEAGGEPMYSPSLELGLFPGSGGSTGVQWDGFEYSFEIDFATTYWLAASLRAVVMDAIGVADYSHTVNFDLDLPEGVSFTSASGYFLSDKLGQQVPEPGALLLACTALALLGLSRRRRG